MISILRHTVLTELNKHREELINLLLKDSVHDFASYRHLVGKIRGIEDSINIIKTIFKGDINDINN